MTGGARLEAYVNSLGTMVWQAAFVGQNGLRTLVVEAMTQYDWKGNVRECCYQCNIQFMPDQSSVGSPWAAFENDLQEVVY